MSQRFSLRKAAILCVLAATSALPAFFVRLDEPTRALNAWKLLAKIGSLCGTVLLFWQFLLGYRQAVARWVTPDYLWTIGLHKALGVGGVALILLHPVFITPYYLRKFGVWVFFGDLDWPATLLVPLGMAALLILLVLVATSTLLRERMGRRAWYLTHLSSYAVLPMAFVHGYPIGMTLGQTGLRYFWQGLFVLTAVFFALRLLAGLGVFSLAYEVTSVRRVSREVVELTMAPAGRPVKPTAAQFAFFRRKRFGPSRPFTVSKYDEATGALSITVKAFGHVTQDLQGAEKGERFLVDGPYGVFGRDALASDRPIVMLAGGIGVTPFRRLIAELRRQPERKAHLFYGNQYEEEIAHRDEIEKAPHVSVVHVLSGVEEHEELETGYITVELLEKHIEDDLPACEFLICGPPVMVKKLEAGLRAAGVPKERVHHELFSY